MKGKNAVADYLAQNAINEAEVYAKGTAWTRCIWDVTAVAWLLNKDESFMRSRLIPVPVPTYDNLYASKPNAHLIRYVYDIKRDNLATDMFRKLTGC